MKFSKVFTLASLLFLVGCKNDTKHSDKIERKLVKKGHGHKTVVDETVTNERKVY